MNSEILLKLLVFIMRKLRIDDMDKDIFLPIAWQFYWSNHSNFIEYYNRYAEKARRPLWDNLTKDEQGDWEYLFEFITLSSECS